MTESFFQPHVGSMLRSREWKREEREDGREERKERERDGEVTIAVVPVHRALMYLPRRRSSDKKWQLELLTASCTHLILTDSRPELLQREAKLWGDCRDSRENSNWAEAVKLK